jgi:hypothetical protein
MHATAASVTVAPRQAIENFLSLKRGYATTGFRCTLAFTSIAFVKNAKSL